MRGFAAALCALGLTLAGPAFAQNEDYQQQARDYLDAGLQAHAALGYSAVRGQNDLIVPLSLESPHLWEINLRAGVNYRVYGACDNDCSDLDMEIYGPDGSLVDRDVATNDTPYVQVTPERNGSYYVRAWVFACSSEPCYSGFRVVSGGTPAERAEEAAQQVASDDYMGVVHAELEDAGAAHLAAGYTAFGEDSVQAIGVTGEGYRQAVHLEGGRSYVFQGACDQDCSDVDLEILDPSGASVARDVETDDRPVVAVNPAASGDYTVRIWLAQCGVEPCYVGIRGFVR